MKHWKKMIAPVVVAMVTIMYYIGIVIFLMAISVIPAIVRVFMAVTALILAVVMAGVLISRIKEIQGGEEDDLSQY